VIGIDGDAGIGQRTGPALDCCRGGDGRLGNCVLVMGYLAVRIDLVSLGIGEDDGWLRW
jgi:hypothetical protein